MENHIEIAKEDIPKLEYLFRPFPGTPKPQRDRNKHGDLLKTGLVQTITSISETRKNLGIEADSLLVIELSSETVQPNIDILQTKMNLAVVEEVQLANGKSKIVVQFEDKAGINTFEIERDLWAKDDPNNTVTLTYAQRRDLFACIDEIRPLSREDRTGRRLSIAIDSDSLPDGLFIVDIDVWYNGDLATKNTVERTIKQALGTGGSTLLGDLFVLPNLLLGRANVNRFTLNALRDLDLIAFVDLPMGTLSIEQCDLYSADFVPIPKNALDSTAPLAAVIDSGVFSGNPLLSSLIVDEEDFDHAEHTPSDSNGHGTGVAGIVAYGDFTEFDKENRIFKPLVRICNGKVMHNDNGKPSYSADKRPEQLVKEAIEYFYKKCHCRVFNLSSGDDGRLYNGGRQMAWASLLDELSRELDIVIVVSAGNVSNPNIPQFTNREELVSKIRDQLLTPEHRLIDPATTALGITVGSITRYSEPESIPERPISISAGDADTPSVFTRTGNGVNGAIKPEFVDYGGNYAIHQITAGQTRWQKTNRALCEPTISNDISKYFKGNIGTSFSAPHVTHVAARLERALQMQIGDEPSANLIRALLASSAKCCKRGWLESATPPNFQGVQKQTQAWRLRLGGYCKVDDTTLFTDRNHVTLFADDALDLRSIHLYKIPVPNEFLDLRTNKRITIGFAYNPPVRLSRKAYIANSLWFEVFRRIDVETLLRYKGKKEKLDEVAADNIIENFSSQNGAKFHPGYTEVRDSTLQQRIWEKKRKATDLLWDNNEPYIYVLVTGKAKFKHPYEQIPQAYAVAITFSFDTEEDIQLRQKLYSKVKLKQRVQVRTRTRIQV